MGEDGVSERSNLCARVRGRMGSSAKFDLGIALRPLEVSVRTLFPASEKSETRLRNCSDSNRPDTAGEFQSYIIHGMFSSLHLMSVMTPKGAQGCLGGKHEAIGIVSWSTTIPCV